MYIIHQTKQKKIKDWLLYIFNSFLCQKIVLVSKRDKNEFMYKLNNLLFKNKVSVIENGINIQKFSND